MRTTGPRPRGTPGCAPLPSAQAPSAAAARRALIRLGLACAFAATTLAAAAQTIGPVADDASASEVFAAPAPAAGDTKAEVVFYGQINPVFQRFDDGAQTTSGIVDNGNWNSRLGVRISRPLDSGTLRFRFETGLGLRSSAAITQNAPRPDWVDWRRRSLRWFEAGLDSGFGSLSLGQGSTATDGVAGLDDSFTFIAGGADSTDGFNAFRFRDRNGQLTDITIGAVNDTFGGNRRFRLRYDTPAVAGFVLSTSHGREVLNPADKRRFHDIALRWNGTLGDFTLQTAAGYGWDNDPNGPNRQRVAGGVSVVHGPSGLNLAVSASSLIDGPEHRYIRAGWRGEVFDAGITSLSVDYYHGRDFVSRGARTENFGLYAVQSFDRASVDAYAGWRRFTYGDRQGGGYRNADGLLIGARWFF